MAASQAQKLEAATMLANGRTEAETASAIGVSRSTVQGWKRRTDFQQLMEKAQEGLAVAAVSEYGHSLLGNIRELQSREPTALEGLWGDFLGVQKLLSTAIASVEPEELGLRAVPALANSCISLLEAYLMVADRISGLEILGSAIIKMGNEIGVAAETPANERPVVAAAKP